MKSVNIVSARNYLGAHWRRFFLPIELATDGTVGIGDWSDQVKRSRRRLA